MRAGLTRIPDGNSRFMSAVLVGPSSNPNRKQANSEIDKNIKTLERERARGGGLTKQEFEGRINREIEKKKSAQVDLVKKLGVGAESVIVGRAGGIRRSLGATSGQKRSGTAPVTRTPFPVYRLTVRLFEYFLVGATGIEPVTP
ncbi:MAG: hypothetical protein WCH32_16580 [Pseudomonadota bacterium]